MFAKVIVTFLLTLLCIFQLAIAGDIMALQVIESGQSFIDLKLREKLGDILSGIEGIDLIRLDSDESQASSQPFSGEQYCRMADKCGARYLIWVRVVQAGSNIKSSTVLPFVFKAHKRKYILETELRIIDSQYGKIIRKKKFTESCNSSRALSYLDLDETNEPALHASYPQQLRIFGELEDKTAEKIVQEIIGATHPK